MLKIKFFYFFHTPLINKRMTYDNGLIHRKKSFYHFYVLLTMQMHNYVFYSYYNDLMIACIVVTYM